MRQRPGSQRVIEVVQNKHNRALVVTADQIYLLLQLVKGAYIFGKRNDFWNRVSIHQIRSQISQFHPQLLPQILRRAVPRFRIYFGKNNGFRGRVEVLRLIVVGVNGQKVDDVRFA